MTDPYREFYEETGWMLERWDRQDREFVRFLLGLLCGAALVALCWLLS